MHQAVETFLVAVSNFANILQELEKHVIRK